MKTLNLFLALVFIPASFGLQAKMTGLHPDTVKIGLLPVSIDHIDVKNQTFDAEFYIDLEWIGTSHTPERLNFVNGWDVNTSNEFHDYRGDTIHYDAKKRGTFRSKFDVSKYPRDRQTLTIQIENYDWNTDSLVYVTDTTTIEPGLSPAGWSVTCLSDTVYDEYYKPGGESFSCFEFSVSLERSPWPFIIRIFIPLIAIFLMSYLNFWIPAEEFQAQAGIGVTSLLSIVAYHLLVRGELPDVGYPTTADILMIGSYFFIFLAMVESIVVNCLFRKDRADTSARVDGLCRWLFPLAYILFVAIIFIFA